MGAAHALPARAPLPAGFVESVRAVFGARLHLGEAMRREHGRSETHFAEALPDAVVFAHTTEEVVALVKLCAGANVPIIPFGAGTSIEGNTIPVRGGVTLDLSEMTKIVAVNPEDFDCTVEAGVRREQLNEHLRDQGLFFPIDPGANATHWRHGLDPRLRHQRRALRHHARSGALAARGHARRARYPHRTARAQIRRRLRSHTADDRR